MKALGWVFACVLLMSAGGCATTQSPAAASSEESRVASSGFGAGDSLGTHLRAARRTEAAPRTDFATLEQD